MQNPSLSSLSGLLSCFRPFPNLAQVCLYKQTAVAGKHAVDVTASCLITASPSWRLCPVQRVQHRPWPLLPWAGAPVTPLWARGCCSTPQASQCRCVGRREDATHERVMTTPTQLWHNVLDTLLWQPKSISGDCGFPLKEWWAHTSSRRGVSPLPLYPFSHRVKVCSHWNLSSFSERDILNPTGDTESEQIQLIPLCQLVTAHPAAVNAQ